LLEVEAPTFSDIRLTDGGKVVSPTRRPLFTPRKSNGHVGHNIFVLRTLQVNMISCTRVVSAIFFFR
jgi:hypothetical protein